MDLGVARVAVDHGGRLLGRTDAEPLPQPDHAFGGPDGDDVRCGDEQGHVGGLDDGRARGRDLGAAVDDDHVVPAAQGGGDLPGGEVADLLAALALRRGEQQAEAGGVGEDGVLEDARRDVVDAGEVGDRAPELDVEVGGDVPGLQVHVGQGDAAPGGVRGEGELDGGDGRADTALGADDRDERAAGRARARGALAGGGAEVAADAGGPVGGGLDAGAEFLRREGQRGDAAGAAVHGGGVERGPGVGGHEDDAGGGEAQGDLPDEFERGHGADALVDEDHLGQLVDRGGGERGEGLEQPCRVAHGLQGFGVGQPGEEPADGAGGVRVADGREDSDRHRGPASVLSTTSTSLLAGATCRRRGCTCGRRRPRSRRRRGRRGRAGRGRRTTRRRPRAGRPWCRGRR